jgi:hypothetical protein
MNFFLSKQIDVEKEMTHHKQNRRFCYEGDVCEKMLDYRPEPCEEQATKEKYIY